MIKFAKSHEWADIDGSIAKVGISVFAASELGDIVYVALPQIGETVVAGKSFCEVESVKAVTEIISPISGTIVEVNRKLEDAPEKINESAMDAWIAKIEMSETPYGLLDECDYLAME